MRFSTSLLSFLAASGLVAAREAWEYDNYEQVNPDLSYGQEEQVWNKQDHHKIPGWRTAGENGYSPEILSDRIILTPAQPGGKRGSIWAQKPEPHNEWVADFEFRVTGPKGGSGNLQVWFAEDGEREVGLSSMYTVGKFRGLVINISPYGKNGGSVRGFLNDGNLSFKDHSHVDRLAFGACDFPYRNVGHFSHMQVRYMDGMLEVDLNHKNCFRSSKVKLPAGYTFGVTAASADNPDSIESKSFVVSHDDWTGPVRAAAARKAAIDAANQKLADEFHWIPESEQIKDAPASDFRDEKQRFTDLHDRVTLANHQADALYQDLSALKDFTEQRHDELRGSMMRMEELLNQMKKELDGKDYRQHLELLANAIHEGHNAVLHHVPQTISTAFQITHGRLWFFAFIIIGSQGAFLVSYMIYKRRLDRQPKKFL